MSGIVVWFTGLPASGKTTLAQRVQQQAARRHPCLLLDSDAVRAALADQAYADDDRDRFYATLSRIAVLAARQGLVVLVAATAPRRTHRELARRDAPAFVEVHVRTSLAECEQRDPKALYARARSGEVPTLPGVGAPYEAPEHPEVVAEGGRDEAAAAVVVQRIDALVAER